MRKILSWLHRVVASEASGAIAWALVVTLSAAYAVEFVAERIL